MKKLNLLGLAIIFLVSCNQEEAGTPREKATKNENKNRTKGDDARDLANSEIDDASNRVVVSQITPSELEEDKSNPPLQEQKRDSVNLDKHSNWMELTFTDNQEKKLRDIVIPGTHNSGTSKISISSDFASGSEMNHQIIDIIRAIPLLNNFVDSQIKEIISNWSRTQNKSIKDQLMDGIRFLDLRVAPSKQTGAFMIVHGQESIELSEGLQEIKDFVSLFPKEIVFVKSQLSYDYRVSVSDVKRSDSQKNMEWMITKYLDAAVYKAKADDVNIADVWASSKSIILLSNNNLVNAWGQIHSNQEETLLKNIDAYLAAEKADKFVEICLCLTPGDDDIIRFIAERYKVDGLVDFIGGVIDSGRDIIDRIFLTNNDSLALKNFQSGLHSKLISNMNQWNQKNYRMNIMSVDFYDDIKFIDQVIQMNK